MCVAVELDDAGTPAEFDVEAVRVLDDCEEVAANYSPTTAGWHLAGQA